jgi:ABC-type amino acid transport substrate-binding protein
MRTLIFLLLIFSFATSNADSHTGTLKRIAETGEFRIGYIPDAPPLSFEDDEGNVVGYSIDLCRRVAAATRDQLGLEKVDIIFTPLPTMEERLNAVEKGKVDIECGTTTVTLSRRERVDFSLMTFITGSAVLSLQSDPIDRVDDMVGAKIAVLGGTTTEDVLRRVMEINEFKIKLKTIGSHTEGMELLNAGKVAGYASDRSMLIGQVFRNADASKEYAMTRSPLSFEPYALMLPRGDTDFRLVTDKALASLYRGAGIRRLYHKWFGRYGEPLSPIVEAMYEFQAVGE